MGIFEDIEHELERWDESAPPIEEPDDTPRAVEVNLHRLAVIHEFGLWAMFFLASPGDGAGTHAAQRARLHQAILTVGEAERADPLGTPAERSWRDPCYREAWELVRDRRLHSYSDRQFAAVLREQQSRPWPIGDIPSDSRQEIGRQLSEQYYEYMDPLLWIYKSHVFATTEAYDSEYLHGCREAAVSSAVSISEGEGPGLQALLTQLPDVADLPLKERAQLAAGKYWTNEWGPVLVNNAVAAPKRHPGRPHIPEAVRNEVWRRDQGTCVQCGSQMRLEFDHVIPVSRGGSNTPRNLQLLCGACNREKGDRIRALANGSAFTRGRCCCRLATAVTTSPPRELRLDEDRRTVTRSSAPYPMQLE